MTVTLHERIRGEIENAILSGELVPGARLPTERELMEKYDCARMTVSKALTELAVAGLINRNKRAGSFVTQPKVHSMVLDIPDLQQEVLQRGEAYRFELVGRKLMKPNAKSPLQLQLAGDGELLQLEGVHFPNATPLAHEVRLISLAAVPEIAEVAFDEISPGAWLLGHVPWTQAETRIAAVPASGAVAKRLDITAATACLLVERRTWRGEAGITHVSQHFVGTEYDLVARFGPAKTNGEYT